MFTAVAGFVLFSPALFARWQWVGEVAKYVMAGGIAGMGFAAKDSTTHSTEAEPQLEPTAHLPPAITVSDASIAATYDRPEFHATED